MRATADLLLWLLVQMPLAFATGGAQWVYKHLNKAYWRVLWTRRRLMGKPMFQPYDVMITSTHPARSE